MFCGDCDSLRDKTKKHVFHYFWVLVYVQNIPADPRVVFGVLGRLLGHVAQEKHLRCPKEVAQLVPHAPRVAAILRQFRRARTTQRSNSSVGKGAGALEEEGGAKVVHVDDDDDRSSKKASSFFYSPVF